jgi:hypothetical protein
MQAAVALTNAIRSHDYRLFEDSGSKELAERFPIPRIDGSTAEEWRRSSSALLDRAHQTANSAQTYYHNAVIRSAACLALAFTALSLGTLPPQFSPLTARFDWPSIELLLSWLELIGLSFVLLLFIHGHVTRRPWVVTRVGTELLRQYQILSMVFPNAFSTVPVGDLKARLETEADLIVNSVQQGPIKDIVGRIDGFWKTRRAKIESRTLTDTDLTVDALLVYLERRARRQLGWFTASNARLEHIASVAPLCW